MSLSKRHIAILALIGAHIIWGAAAPIVKWALQDISPFTLAFLRFVLAAFIILPFVYRHLKINIKDFPKLFFLAFIGITAHIAFFFFGLEFTSSINVPVISAAAPIVLIIGSVLYLKEKAQKKVIVGTVISLCGVFFLILRPFFEEGHDGSILGNFFIALSALCVVFYTLLLKKYKLPYSSLTIVFWTFTIGGLLFAPGMITEVALSGTVDALTPRALIAIAYGAILSSALAYFFYNFGVAKLKANEVGVFTYVDPITTILIAIPLLGETITISYVIGGLLVFTGIFIAEGRLYAHPLHRVTIKKD